MRSKAAEGGNGLQRVCSEAAEAAMSGSRILIFIIDMSQIYRDCCLCVGDLLEGSADRPDTHCNLTH